MTRDSTRLFAVEIPHTTIKELLRFVARILHLVLWELTTMHPVEIARSISQQWPCRELQSRQLASLLSVSLSISLYTVYLYTYLLLTMHTTQASYP